LTLEKRYRSSNRRWTPGELRGFCTLQLHRLIERGIDVAACKAEWKRRWGLEYPLYREGTKIRSYIVSQKRR